MVLGSIILGLAAAMFLAISDLLSRGASKVQGPYATAVHQMLIGTGPLVVAGAILSPGAALTPVAVALMASAAVLNFAAVIFLYRGLHQGVVSVVAPIVYSYPAVTLVLSIFLLGVSVSALQALTLVGIIAGAILVSTRFSDLRGTRSGGFGVRSAVLASLLGGLSYLTLGASVRLAGPFLPTLFLRGVGALSGFLIAPVARQNVRVTRYTFSPRIFAVATFAVAAFLAFNWAVGLDANSLPIVTALSGIGGAFEATYAILFIREKLEPNQMAGIALLVACVFALLYLRG